METVKAKYMSNNKTNSLYNLILQLQNEIKKLKNKNTKQNSIKHNTMYTMHGNRKCYTTYKYCWTHGACAHSSSECKTPKPEHTLDAIFTNKQGGSTDFCLPNKCVVGLMIALIIVKQKLPYQNYKQLHLILKKKVLNKVYHQK